MCHFIIVDYILSFLPSFLFFFLSYCLILQDVPDLYFPSPALELVISARRPGSFHWIMVLETRSWSLVPGRLTRWGDICVYTNQCVSTCLFICLSCLSILSVYHVCLLMSTLAVYACPSIYPIHHVCLYLACLSIHVCLSIYIPCLSCVCICHLHLYLY